jgi:hypothetical protein
MATARARALDAAASAQAIVEGSILGNYVFGTYLTQDKDRKRQVRQLTVVCESAQLAAATEGREEGRRPSPSRSA